MKKKRYRPIPDTRNQKINKGPQMKKIISQNAPTNKLQATLSYEELGMITLILHGGSMRNFPLLQIRFDGGPSILPSYLAIVLDAPEKIALPAEGPITFPVQRGADQDIDAVGATTTGGMYGILERAAITDINGDEFMIAMVEQVGDMPISTDGYPYFLVHWGDKWPELSGEWESSHRRTAEVDQAAKPSPTNIQ